MAATRDTSRFGGGRLAGSLQYFEKIRKENLTYVRRAHRHLQGRTGGRSIHSFASCKPYASTSESGSDDFDHGALFLGRHDQRDQLFQTSSSDSTQSWAQGPNQSWQNHWRERSQNSWDESDYHDSWWQGSCVFSPQPIFSRCRCGSRLLSRWRREAVRSLTKPRNTQARRQSQSQ